MALGDMPIDLYFKILEQLPHNTVIVPFFRGEPLLHPEFPLFMKALHKFKTVQLATNGDYLTTVNQEAIIDNVSFVSVSLHEFQYPSETNFLGFLYYCSENKVKTQISILSKLIPFTETRYFIKAWKVQVDRVRLYQEHSVSSYGDVQTNNKSDDKPCQKPFEDLVIYWNGKVALCNHDWKTQMFLGDLNKQSVVQVWNNQAHRWICKSHRAGHRQWVVMCRNCDMWQTSYLPQGMFGELY
jgi:radical SAM protein with 4Fe4S-binding SPASM domain